MDKWYILCLIRIGFAAGTVFSVRRSCESLTFSNRLPFLIQRTFIVHFPSKKTASSAIHTKHKHTSIAKLLMHERPCLHWKTYCSSTPNRMTFDGVIIYVNIPVGAISQSTPPDNTIIIVLKKKIYQHSSSIISSNDGDTSLFIVRFYVLSNIHETTGSKVQKGRP